MPSSIRGRSRANSNSSEFTHVSPEYTHIPPEYIHRAIPGHGDYPSAAGSTYTVSKRDQGLVSPAQSSFSFADSEAAGRAISTPPSPAPSLYSGKPPNTIPLDEKTMAEPIDRAIPVDENPIPRSRTPLEKELVRKRSQYYNDVFAARDSNITPHEQVCKDSVITVEVKTNVIVRDEFLFLDELSEHLSQRYQRPTSSILITLEHSACFLFAGSFESAYIVTITALPSLLQPSANKRNTALIQSHLASSLGVFPDRGIIKFTAISEAYFAISGTTYSGHVERLQRKANEIGASTPAPPPPPKKDIIRSASIKNPPKRSSSIASTRSRRSLQLDPPAITAVLASETFTSTPAKTPFSAVQKRQTKSVPGSRLQSPPPPPPIPWDNDPQDRIIQTKVERAQRLGKRKSFFAFFGRL